MGPLCTGLYARKLDPVLRPIRSLAPLRHGANSPPRKPRAIVVAPIDLHMNAMAMITTKLAISVIQRVGVKLDLSQPVC